ncbi:MAG: TIGR04255 family protein [Actinomycetota bacterium]|jgi:uncharacterized protein (TIGR04255 family)|nr:TIGR04255 family protein [Actinomycetota bacterium]
MTSDENPGDPAHLPDFEDPPVVEVALGVQFRPIPRLRPVEMASLREQWRSEYPVVLDQPPLPPTIEQPTSGPRTTQLVFGPALQTRLWFLSEDQSSLVQIQHDRLTVNWRKLDGVPYPRYPAVRDMFDRSFDDVEEFVADRGFGPLEITQVEANYINRIDAADEGRGHLEEILRHWSSLAGHHLGDPEEARVAMVFRVPEIGTPPVRLYVECAPAQQVGQAPVLLLTLTVRGAPTTSDLGSALGFMDKAHAHIVHSFAELTTDAMHEHWRRNR